MFSGLVVGVGGNLRFQPYYTRTDGTPVWQPSVDCFSGLLLNGNSSGHISFRTNIPDVMADTLIDFRFRNDYIAGQFDISNVNVEIGTKETTYSQAPEDIDKKISDTETTLNDNIDSAVSDAQTNILDNVGQNYATKDSATEISESLASFMEQTATDIGMVFTNTKTYVDDGVGSDLSTYKETVSTHIRFNDNGMELGKSDSPFTATLDNTELAFNENGVKVAHISNNTMNITRAEIKDVLKIGEATQGFFTWSQGSNGNMSLKWSDE